MLGELLAEPVRVTMTRSLGNNLSTVVLCVSTRHPRTGEWAALLFVAAAFVADLDLRHPGEREWLQLQVGAAAQARSRAMAC